MNALALLLLVYFIYAILGVFWFRNITEGTIIDPIYFNFKDFHHSFILCIRMSTGEDWPTTMFDTTRTAADNCLDGINCGTKYSPLYFISFQVICAYVMINLFVLIIL